MTPSPVMSTEHLSCAVGPQEGGRAMANEFQIQPKVSGPRDKHEEGPLLSQATGTKEGSSTDRGAKSYEPHVASTQTNQIATSALDQWANQARAQC